MLPSRLLPKTPRTRFVSRPLRARSGKKSSNTDRRDSFQGRGMAMDKERWEHFSHGADIGVRGFGASKESAFEQAGLAAIAAMVDLATVKEQTTLSVECEAPDDELLLVDWLNAIVFQIATRKMLFHRFEIKIDRDHLSANLYGEKIDLERHQPCVEIMGATHTEARVYQEPNNGWVAQCVVDV